MREDAGPALRLLAVHPENEPMESEVDGQLLGEAGFDLPTDEDDVLDVQGLEEILEADDTHYRPAATIADRGTEPSVV